MFIKTSFRSFRPDINKTSNLHDKADLIYISSKHNLTNINTENYANILVVATKTSTITTMILEPKKEQSLALTILSHKRII